MAGRGVVDYLFICFIYLFSVKVYILLSCLFAFSSPHFQTHRATHAALCQGVMSVLGRSARVEWVCVLLCAVVAVLTVTDGRHNAPKRNARDAKAKIKKD